MKIIGHNKIIATLEKSLENGNISQAYLFSGPESVGKFSLAKEFAFSAIYGKTMKSLNDQERKNAVIDLVVIGPEIDEKKGIIKEREIKIDQIREAQKNILLFPFRGRYKVLIIDNADKMTIASQNSLLKTLEEPNSTSIIIIISKDDLKIIPTIKSRCQRINFSLVESRDIEDNIKIENVDLAMGRPGLAKRILENEEEVYWRKDALEKIEKIPNFGINERLDLAEEFSKNIPQAINKLEIWTWFLRKMAIDQENNAPFEKIKKIEESLDILRNTNANSRLVLECLLISM